MKIEKTLLSDIYPYSLNDMIFNYCNLIIVIASKRLYVEKSKKEDKSHRKTSRRNDQFTTA